QSLLDGPSTVFWVAVAACTVFIRPRLIPHLSWITLASGASELVVHEALETIFSPLYLSWLTPNTNIGVSSFDGADSTTFFAPASRCFCAASLLRNRPVDSITTSTSTSPHFRLAGSRSWLRRMRLPLTIRWPPSTTTTSPLNGPWTES